MWPRRFGWAPHCHPAPPAGKRGRGGGWQYARLQHPRDSLACQEPPAAVLTLRSFSSAAMAANAVILSALIFSMIARTFAACRARP